MRKITLFVLSLCILLSAAGCKKAPASRAFIWDELAVTLTNEFKEKSEGYLTLYTDDIKVVIQSTPTESISNISLEEYASLLGESMGFLSALNDVDAGNALVYEYNLDGDGFESSSCLIALYKTDKFYYNVTFACAADEYESNKEMFIEWIDSIQIG